MSHVQPGVFWVQEASESETSEGAHTVSFGDASNLPSCDCLDWQQYRLPCKHLCSVFSSFPEWGWDMLNASYTANPLINLDYSCITPWLDTQHEKPEQRLSHYTITPTYSLKEGSRKVMSKTKPIEVFKEQTTIDANDIKISGVELEVPVDDKLTSSADFPSTSALNDSLTAEDGQTSDIALQCRDLLSNLAHLTSKKKHDQIAKLKADLEASIRILQETVDDEETVPQMMEVSAASEDVIGVSGSKRPSSLLQDGVTEDKGESSKRFKMDDDDEEDIFDKNESDAEGSYISDEGEPVGAPVATDIEDETVEISTEPEEEEEDDEEQQRQLEEDIVIKIPQQVEQEDVPIQTILTRPRVEELTPEQRERKMLAILTAST